MPRLLMVEDNPSDRTLVRFYLRQHARLVWEIEHAGAIADAKIKLHAVPAPDLLLLDLGLPDSHGVGTLQTLFGIAQLPIVVMTGAREAATTCTQTGVGFIAKDSMVDNPAAFVVLLETTYQNYHALQGMIYGRPSAAEGNPTHDR